MPVLPFHRYIGPGNDIDNGPCVDADDCIAKRHDIKYENARTERDVRIADIEAINEFRENWLQGNWHSLIGDIGLSIKYCVESYTGVLYPKLSEYKPCEIIPLFNDLLKLHCVHKTRLFDRYTRLYYIEPDNNYYELNKIFNFSETCANSSPTCFYVLVTWYQLYNKNHVNPDHTHLLIAHHINNKKCGSNLTVANPSRTMQYCDMFNLKAWVRMFTLFHSNGIADTKSEMYSDENFSNMFLNYD